MGLGWLSTLATFKATTRRMNLLLREWGVLLILVLLPTHFEKKCDLGLFDKSITHPLSTIDDVLVVDVIVLDNLLDLKMKPRALDVTS
ncbi:hypothetical protein CR513_62940, partial [Mucuna pruriens]